MIYYPLMKHQRKREPKNIIVATSIGGAAGRDCLSGIFRFMRECANWRIQLFDSPQKITAYAVATADGVITEAPLPQPVADVLRQRPLPVVLTHNTSDHPCDLPVESLRLDDDAIGAEAFRYFSKLGNFASFAVIADLVDRRWTKARERGFCRAAEEKGRKVHSLTLTHDSQGSRDEQEIANNLRQLPKPIALFSVWDRLYLRILGICQSANLVIPDQVSVLGVDNDEILCFGVTPTLSSVKPNHEAVGYTAAKELRRLLNGGTARQMTIRNSVSEILGRDSTRILQPAEHLVRNAKDFIDRHADEDISPRDVVRHLGVSRPLADLRFRELNGRSIRQEIAAARIREIKKQLMSSQNSLESIAIRCGFTSLPALSRYFKRETGQSPSTWRRR